MNCRHCKSPLDTKFLDLGFAPPSNAYLNPEDLHAPELYFPLTLRVCERCWLVQTEDYARADELFRHDYAYFSSVSRSWLNHAAHYAEMITRKLGLDDHSFVIEVASNDGYLLKNFVAAGIPCLGIEPTASTAEASERLGVPVLQEFFGERIAHQLSGSGKQADLVAGNNVYAHVPDINDFTAGVATVLKPEGVVTLEFPHLLQLLRHIQFDTVYHEHYSYLSLYSVCEIFETSGLRIFDVEELSTHGGSLRIYGCLAGSSRKVQQRVSDILAAEADYGMQTLTPYLEFQGKADALKDRLLGYLLEQKRLNRKIAAYGAAAKGNTLLNYAGVKIDLLPCVFDAAPSKQGKFMPGSHIPILAPQDLSAGTFETLLILPWNIADELMDQVRHKAGFSGNFVTAIPELVIR